MQTDLVNIRAHGALPRIRRTALAFAAALALSAASAHAASVFDQPDPDFKGSVSASGVVLPGATATVQGRGFKPGQEIRLLRNGQSIAADAVIKAGADGTFKTTVAVPADAVPGVHPVVVQVANPSAASVFDFKISPQIPFAGADKFDIASAHLKPGLYQSAYSAKTNTLFVTSAVGRPPVKESALMKVDASSLRITASIVPPADPGNDKGQVQAVYGVAVDDEAGTVWVTNTRSNSLAVYRQQDLSLVKQFPNGAAGHPRDVVIDNKRHRAYVSGGEPAVVVFDTQKLEAVGRIELKSRSRENPMPMSLALDAANGKLYTASLTTNDAFAIDLDKQAVEAVYPLPGARGASGVAIVPEQKLLFTASQGSDNVHIVDLSNGSVKQTVSVGAGPLNVAWDPVRKLAYVASRGAGSIAVLDADGKLVANLDGGTFVNHIATDGKGTIFAINKSRGPDDKTGDRISRIILK